MSNTINALGTAGLPALCDHIKSLKNVVVQLGEAFQGTVAEIEEAINDFPIASSISVTTTGWHSIEPANSMGEYNFYYDIIQQNIDSSDLPVVTVSPASISVAVACDLCPSCESFNGFIRLYSKAVPEENLIVQCWVLKGRSDTSEQEYFNEEG